MAANHTKFYHLGFADGYEWALENGTTREFTSGRTWVDVGTAANEEYDRGVNAGFDQYRAEEKAAEDARLAEKARNQRARVLFIDDWDQFMAQLARSVPITGSVADAVREMEGKMLDGMEWCEGAFDIDEEPT